MLPESVLKKAAAEMLDYEGSGAPSFVQDANGVF